MCPVTSPSLILFFALRKHFSRSDNQETWILQFSIEIESIPLFLVVLPFIYLINGFNYIVYSLMCSGGCNSDFLLECSTPQMTRQGPTTVYGTWVLLKEKQTVE